MSHPPSSPRRHPRIGGLFFGYGGLDLAVQSVIPDAELAWYSEFDKGANKIAAHRFPDVPNHGDITKIDWSQVEPVDILTGGSPCQDLSHAGRRAGMTEGTRSNLWVAMREAIAQLRPSMVVWENVRGAYSAGADSAVEPCPGCVGDGSGVSLRALGRVLGDLSDLGYDASWHGLRAADVGAPHGRFRVFVVATDTQSNAGRIEHGDGGAAAIASGLRRGAGWPAGPGEAEGGWASADVAGRGDASVVTLPTPTARDWKNVGDPGKTAARMADRGQPLGEVVVNALLPTPRAGDGEKGGPNQRGSSGDFMLPSAVTHLLPTPKTTDAKSDGPSNMERNSPGLVTIQHHTERWGQYGDAIRRWEHLTRPAPAPTETGPKGNPRLSAAFSEWMMGLPAGWVTDVPGITRNEALKALGNGVVPQQAAAALREMFAWTEVAA